MTKMSDLNNLDFYPFSLRCRAPFSQSVESHIFEMEVDDILGHTTLSYFVEFHCVDKTLIIPRMAPLSWQNKDYCYWQLFSVREKGRALNVRKIVNTVLKIYDTVWGIDPVNALIVSGNYNDDEKHEGPSRKMQAYRNIFLASSFARKYHIFPLRDTTYMMLAVTDIPIFYKHTQLYGKYCEERLATEGQR